VFGPAELVMVGATCVVVGLVAACVGLALLLEYLARHW
jgi:hypothetical protein